jgi:hypothetical protein
VKHCRPTPVLPPKRWHTTVRREIAALRDFKPAYVGAGS